MEQNSGSARWATEAILWPLPLANLISAHSIIMLTQRTQGLYRVFLLCQIVIVAALFWFGVWVMVTFYTQRRTAHPAALQRSIARCSSSAFSPNRSAGKARKIFPPGELLRQHRLALRQTIASVGALVLYLIAAKDAFISRIFFFNFLPLALHRAPLLAPFSAGLSCPRNLWPARREDAPRRLDREGERIARLAAPQSRDVGLRTVGIICEEPLDCTEDSIPVLGGPDRIPRQTIRSTA